MGAAPILTILRNGETVKSLSIEGEAVLGRAEGCVIRLDDRAISRHHAVFRKVTDGVQIEKRSEFGPISVNGTECSQALIKEGDVIEIGPYLLRLSVPLSASKDALPVVAAPPMTGISGANEDSALPEEAVAQELVQEVVPEVLPSAELERAAEGEPQEISELSMSEAGIEAMTSEMIEDDGQTKVSAPEKLAVKLLFRAGDANVEEFELVKDEISIGRGKNCDIVLNDKKASRKNSIIRRAGMSFVIKDLGSANGTWVNGGRITESELTGQDRVRIGDVEFDFQAMSADYVHRQKDFMSVPQEQAPEAEVFDYALPSDSMVAAPEVEAPEAASQMPQYDPDPLRHGAAGMPGAVPGGNAQAGMVGIPGIAGIGGSVQPKSLLARLRQLPMRRQIPYLLAIVSVLYWAFFDEEEPQKKAKKIPKKAGVTAMTGGRGAVSFEALSPEQKRFVEAQHALAFDYYKNKKYDEAMNEIEKIFLLVSDYKDSQEIKRYAVEGKRKLEALEEERRRKEDEARLKARIAQLEEETRERMAKKQYEQARELFAQVLALDPENQAVGKWRSELEQVEEGKRLVEQQIRVQKEINVRAWSVYRDGLALKRKGKFHSAISVFEKVRDIGASENRVLALSRKMIAQSRYAIKARREPLLKEGHEAEAAGEFSRAYHAYLGATKVDPPHPEGYRGMNRVKGVLHERAKMLYTEAVLSESYSDFNVAKKKFKECLDVAPKDDIYYERAERKLARYFKKSGEEVQP